MKGSENTFVFAVCGGQEHIDTLNLALRYLRKYSRQNILVVTELSRNAAAIEHGQVLDVETPAHFDHHQASIYLKTGLHRFVDLSRGKYCYLDSDVLAVDAQVDAIFDQKSGPVTFAADHCRMREFSPYTLHCGCAARQDTLQIDHNPILEALIGSWEGIAEQSSGPMGVRDPERRREVLALLEARAKATYISDPSLRASQRHLLDLFAEGRKKGGFALAKILLLKILPRYFRHPFRRVWYDWRGRVVVHEDIRAYFRRRHGLEYRPAAGGWYDRQGDLVLEGFDELIHARTGFRWNPVNYRFEDEAGEPMLPVRCDHLREQIQAKFGIEVGEADWQHWNGGVFLFDADSVPFLDDWHGMTMEIFRDPHWRTRDQGTLIATVWKHGLNGQAPLSPAFNFLADYQSADLAFSREKGFSRDGFKSSIRPHLVHIYHHFGDRSWDVWRWVESRL